jgi:uncharacterized protein (DUF2252 family)
VRALSPTDRGETIVDVFDEAFSALAARDPVAFRGKFRKMASGAFAFYRGSACLFFADVVRDDDPFATGDAARIWIHGDLHAANFGTYMDGAGRLVFDVNDFDEAYVGPFTWDVRRLAASLALLGYEKALSDDDIMQMIDAFARSYLAQVRRFASQEHTADFALLLGNSYGHVLQSLRDARIKSRVALLDDLTVMQDYDRRFRLLPDVTAVDSTERAKVEEAFHRYLDTIPDSKRQARRSYNIKDIVAKRGVGIGSAGLPSYNLLLDGRTEALENDAALYMKQACVAAPSRVVHDERVAGYFANHGERTVISQRALQAYADPWLGYTELDGVGQVVAEINPYQNDLDWSDVNDLDEIIPLLTQLGQAVAKIHCVADADSDQTLVATSSVDRAVLAAVGDRDEDFVTALVAFGRGYGEVARRDHSIFVDLFRNHQVLGL